MSLNWTVAGPEVARIVDEFELDSGRSRSYKDCG